MILRVFFYDFSNIVTSTLRKAVFPNEHPQPTVFHMARSPHNRLDLEERVEREPRDLDGRPRGLVVPKERGVDRVDGLEVVHVVQEDLQAARTAFGTPHMRGPDDAESWGGGGGRGDNEMRTHRRLHDLPQLSSALLDDRLEVLESLRRLRLDAALDLGTHPVSATEDAPRMNA